MARIIWTEPALSDLNEIAEYIALDKLDAARRLVNRKRTTPPSKNFSGAQVSLNFF